MGKTAERVEIIGVYRISLMMMLELNYHFGYSIGGEGNGDLFRFMSLDKNEFLAVYDRPHCRFYQVSFYT